MYPCAEEPWCVLEKVHGANFSFTTDGVEVIPAKRTSFLRDFKTFYNCKNLVEKIVPRIQEIFNMYDQATSITVYGELFGGHYEGMKLQCQMIQKGVQYCPHHEFMAYDILIVNKDGSTRFENYHKAIELFKNVGLFYADILFEGSMDECLKWSADHNADSSTIPARLGLDELKENVREGHVLKPIDPAFTIKNVAIVLKDKNDKFKEKSSVKKNYTDFSLTPELQNLVDDALSYVTETRWDGLISKHGPPQGRKEIGQYIGLLAKDVMTDFHKDNDLSLGASQKKQLSKEVNQACRKLVLRKI
uniref:RNA ligase domain-containing protein n=1 Tax=viral metagenome TaxID=1070528 RepID=A0A6C0EMR5_9ZZZZ